MKAYVKRDDIPQPIEWDARMSLELISFLIGDNPLWERCKPMLEKTILDYEKLQHETWGHDLQSCVISNIRETLLENKVLIKDGYPVFLDDHVALAIRQRDEARNKLEKILENLPVDVREDILKKCEE